MNDFWSGCYDPKMGMDADQFRQTFCNRCNNSNCVRSEGETARKIKHNLAMLSPVFADPNDPRRLAIPDFQNMFQEAMRIEVSSRKNDWSIPTAQDITSVAQEVLEQVQRQVFEVPSESDPKKTYQVVQYPDGTWGCNCPAFVHGRTVPCKHIQDLQQPKHFEVTAKEEPVVEAPTPNLGKAIYPPSKNTPSQIMPDNTIPRPAERVAKVAPKPQVDPWAAPVKKDVIIPVGGKIVLGGK